jgi:hypothetical protein
MNKRYELRHDTLGQGYRYTDLGRAQKELAHAVPVGEWFIFDRLTKERVG